MGGGGLEGGDQDAWIATRIGLPAFWASAKVLASKDGAVSAKAGETTMAVAIREAFRIERRDNMETLLFGCGSGSYVFEAAALRGRGFLCGRESRPRGARTTSRNGARPGDQSTTPPRPGRREHPAYPPPAQLP